MSCKVMKMAVRRNLRQLIAPSNRDNMSLPELFEYIWMHGDQLSDRNYLSVSPADIARSAAQAYYDRLVEEAAFW